MYFLVFHDNIDLSCDLCRMKFIVADTQYLSEGMVQCFPVQIRHLKIVFANIRFVEFRSIQILVSSNIVLCCMDM